MNENHIALMEAFSEAFNRHDLDAILALMTDDCVFVGPMGNAPAGKRYVGKETARAAFGAIWQAHPDAQWNNGRYSACGDRGFSEWTYSGTAADGTQVHADGCDLFTFRDGKVAVKDAFRKQAVVAAL